MLNRHNLTIASLASKEASRYALGSILIAPERTVVTDGRLLATVSTPTLPAESVPTIDGFAPTNTFRPFQLPAEDAMAIAKAIPKSTNLPILENAFVDAGTDGKAKIAVTNLESSRVFEIRKPAGSYPQVDQVIPALEDSEIAIALNPNLLISLLRALVPLLEKDSGFILRVKDAKTPIRLDFESTQSGQRGIGILMPMQGEGTHGVRPRKLTIEVQDGRIRNAWTDSPMEIQFVNRKGVEIKGAALWTGEELTPTSEIPEDIRAFLAPKAEQETGTEPTPIQPAAPAEAAETVSVSPVPEDSAGRPVVDPAFWARKREERSAGKPAAGEEAPVAIEVATTPVSPRPEAPKDRKRVSKAIAPAQPTTPKLVAAPVPPRPAAIVPAGETGNRKPTPEALAKMRAASKAYWASKRAAKSA